MNYFERLHAGSTDLGYWQAFKEYKLFQNCAPHQPVRILLLVIVVGVVGGLGPALAQDAQALFKRGVAHDLGQGVAPNAMAACADYRAAADLGHVQGAFNAGVMLDAGRCGPGGTALAATFYARAAAAGFGRAEFDLAQLYAAGDGVPYNPELADAWYHTAASNGITAAAGRVLPITVSPGPLPPASPVYPAKAERLRSSETVTLVWTAPTAPRPVRFSVELYGLLPTGPQEVATPITKLSALRISLPVGPIRYTWRVLSVSDDPPTYTIGPWRDFTLEP